MRDIDVYPTRIEISPYVVDKDDVVVRQCSTAYDLATHRREEIGCQYIPEEEKLIVMRGMDVNWLVTLLGGYPHFNRPCPAKKLKKGYKVNLRPKNVDQLRAIKFLCGYGEYANNQRYNQLSLNTEPNFGKTYCAITASLERGYRTLVIVHNSTVKDQWKNAILKHTTVPENRILDITGAEKMDELMENPVDVDFIIIMHQSITAYHNSHGYENLKKWFDHLECGTKIVDEVHLFFLSTVRIDLSSNIEKTFYLTGTMTRSNPLEVALFRRYFMHTASFGSDLDKTKNVIYEFVDFDSYPTEVQQRYILTARGVNSARYIKYACKLDGNRTFTKVLLKTLDRCLANGGRTLIILPTIATCEDMRSMIEIKYPESRVMSVHSRNPEEYNENAKLTAEVLISTISSLGTGTDLEGLRNMIIGDLYSSEVTANQLPKRLGRGTNEECYVYELVDNGFEAIRSQVMRKTRYLRKCCKKILHSKYES